MNATYLKCEKVVYSCVSEDHFYFAVKYVNMAYDNGHIGMYDYNMINGYLRGILHERTGITHQYCK